MEAASVFGAECVWWCWGLNTGLCVFQASAFPLTFVPAPGSFICFALLFLVGKCIFYGTVGSQKVNWAYWCPLFCCIFVLVLPSILDDVQSVLGWWQVSCDGNCNLLLLFTEYPVIWSPQAGCSLGSIVQCFNLKIPLTYLLCNSIRYSRGKKLWNLLVYAGGHREQTWSILGLCAVWKQMELLKSAVGSGMDRWGPHGSHTVGRRSNELSYEMQASQMFLQLLSASWK